MANTYNLLHRKIGDGYTYYKFYTPTMTTTPYGEPTLVEVKADDNTFGGTDPSGAEVAIEREMMDDEISQELAPIQRLVVGEKGTFKITVMTGRLENLAVVSGVTVASITNIAANLLPGGVNQGSGLLVGGQITPAFMAVVHAVPNSVSPNLTDWLYMPRCQSGDGFNFTFKKNEMRKFDLTLNIFPAKQDGFLVGIRHALMQLIYEWC